MNISLSTKSDTPSLFSSGKGKKRWGVVILLFFLSLILYIKTLPPSIHSVDSGEFSACSKYLGIAHSPGYPLYIYLAKIFTYLPVGGLAFRVNLFSSIFAALTVILVYIIFLKICYYKPYGEEGEFKKNWWKYKNILFSKLNYPLSEVLIHSAAFFSSLLLCFSQTFWFEALVAEEYTFYCFFLAILILLMINWQLTSDNRYLYLLAFTAGLSIACHPLILASSSAILFFVLVYGAKTLFKLKNFLILTLLLILGLFFYLYFPLRSAADPLFDWGNPETLRNFKYVITLEETTAMYWGIKKLFEVSSWYPFLGGGMYQNVFLFLPFVFYFLLKTPNRKFKNKRRIFIITNTILFLIIPYTIFIVPYLDLYIKATFNKFIYVDLFLKQFPILLCGLGIWGIIVFSREKPYLFFSLFYIFFMSYPYTVIGNFPHNNPIMQERHKIGSYIIFSLFCGYGIKNILAYFLLIGQRTNFAQKIIFFPLLIILLPFITFFQNYKEMDKSRYYFVYDFAQNVLKSVEKNSIILAKSTENVFPLWYLHLGENKRKDVIIVYFDAISNPWYLQYLRNRYPYLLRRPLPTFTMKKWSLTSMQERGEYVNKVIKEIVEENKDTYPIYYLTGADSFIPEVFKKGDIESRGIVFKVLSKKEDTSFEELKHNLYNVYSLRGIKDDKIYKDWIVRAYIACYGNAHFYLANYYLAQGDLSSALKELETAAELNPSNVAVWSTLGLIYDREGDLDKAKEYFEKAASLDKFDPKIHSNLGSIYSYQGKIDKAIEEFKIAIRSSPDYPNAHFNLGLAYARKGLYYQALKELKTVLKLTPEDWETYLYLAQIYQDLKKYDKAEEILSELLNKNKNFPPGYLKLSEVYKTQKKWQKAEEILKKLQEFDKNNPYVKNLLEEIRSKK